MRDDPQSGATADGDASRGWRRPGPAAGSTALTGLFLIALLAAIRVGRPVLLPIVVAALLSFLLTPVVHLLRRWHLPRQLGAGVVVVGVVGVFALGLVRLAEPTMRWLDEAPTVFRRLESELHDLRHQVEKVSEATEKVEELTAVGEKQAAQSSASEPPLAERLLTGSRELLVTVFLVFVLLYFILASGDLFLRKLVEALPRLEDKKRSVDVVRAVQRDISRYLGTVTVINLLLGVAVALSMWGLGMPNPVLWGVMATLFNFVPYLGATAGVLVVAMAGILSFDGWWPSLAPALVYLTLTGLEGYLLTPMLLSQRLTLNPLAILVSLLLWGWLWGIPGALLAVPILAGLKIVCVRFPSTRRLAAFLEG